MSRARDLEELHERGERVTIRWPGGPYHFVLEFDHAEPSTMSGWEHWLMWDRMERAAGDMPVGPPAELFDRFVRWTG